ncbi:type II toxin-antitoxin system YafQ family toxin [Photorhabdus australis]|uniref:type II toxin-antitoxin system YafQ family toxin n=1 Tax=Photorhabdus australis TaxID=286156 RepID=UPI000A68572F|nr:type II toxin-antitoxin system YafQ family toxin [Photorhabdus australis]
MLKIVYQSRFKKDAKRYANNKKAQSVILKAIELLHTGELLLERYREHFISRPIYWLP